MSVPSPTPIKWKEYSIGPLGSCYRRLPLGDKTFSSFKKGLITLLFLKPPEPFPTLIKWIEYSIGPLGSCYRRLPLGDKNWVESYFFFQSQTWLCTPTFKKSRTYLNIFPSRNKGPYLPYFSKKAKDYLPSGKKLSALKWPLDWCGFDTILLKNTRLPLRLLFSDSTSQNRKGGYLNWLQCFNLDFSQYFLPHFVIKKPLNYN